MMEKRHPQNIYINHLDLANQDPELSQFKYHFIVRKVSFQQAAFQELLTSIHLSFGGMKLDPGVISFLQIAQSYENSCHDLVIGFKRDRQALAVYLNSKRFVYQGKESQIQLAEAFRYMLQERGALTSVISESVTLEKVSEKAETRRSKDWIEGSVQKESRSRSREKEKDQLKKREGWAGRLWGVFAPKDWTVTSLTTLLSDTLRCAKNEIHIQSETIEELPTFIIDFRSHTLINNLLAGTRATEGMILLLREEEIKEEGLLQAVRQRQIRAVRVSTAKCDNPFSELCRALISFKEFNLIVVTVTPLQDSYLIIVQNRVLKILKFLRIAGWKFQTVNQCIKLPPSSTQKWQRFLSTCKNY